MDPEVAKILEGEERRQAEGLELIPSENYVSRAVKEAMASSLANKYSEGYVGKRYYGGQQFADEIETLAIERATELFNAGFANVQPLGGANANLAAYAASAAPGDIILGMNLSHGGHLTHGSPATFAAKVFKFISYGMQDVKTGTIDYEEVASIAREAKPKILLAGFSSYPRSLDWKRLAGIAHEVGAIALADVAHLAGLIAGKALPNPLNEGFDVLTMTTHKTLRGPRGGMILTNDAELAKKIDKAVFPGLQGGPHMHQIAAKAVAFNEALQPSFKKYAQQVLENAQAMARVFRDEGVELVTGGTENHLLLLDVTQFDMGGAEAERLLDEAGITVNKNVIPDDPRKPADPSGIRFGTPALTTRGFLAAECAQVAKLMLEVLRSKSAAKAKTEAHALAKSHPIPESFE